LFIEPIDKMAVLTEYTYVFAIGTMFALLEAYNNGASMSIIFPRAHVTLLTPA
jgi:hypothetical protein